LLDILIGKPSTMSQTQTSTTSPADTFADANSDSFRLAMRELAGGVAVVTVGRAGDVTGFTATSVSSLCARPPRLLVCVAQSSNSWQTLQRHPYFGVTLLRHEEHSLANRFAGRDGLEGTSRFDGAQWTTMLTGTPLLENALAAFDCEVTEMLPHCDHAIIVGRVCAARTSTGALPLVYWRGEYRALERDSS
jgi:flavin reductase (DIM6/NTAB) family NADH-FMN oxidoreductase RutF